MSSLKHNLKAVLFDMDGVLFNSMPYHAEAWHKVMKAHNLNLSKEEAYLHEGRTGAATINIVYQRQYGREASEEEIETMYKEKSDIFRQYPQPAPMQGALELLLKVKEYGLTPVLVTGSGERTLLNRLEKHYPGMFVPELMVTAFDVKFGKPHPEPYLIGLKKAGISAEEAIVVENAPLGVQSAVAAKIFTVAVNTGPMPDQVLWDAGANILYPSMQSFCDQWTAFIENL